MGDWLTATILAAFFAADAALFTFFLLRAGPKPKRAVQSPPTRLGTILGWVLLSVFGVACVAGTMYCDYFVVNRAVRHCESMTFDETEGTVVRCEVRVESDGEGATYHIDIDYVYRVGVHEYHGKRVRYYALWGSSFVREFVDAHPAGTQVTVYYDPDDPSNAILMRAWDGSLLWFAMFLVPFNIVMMGILCIAVTIGRYGELPNRPPFEVVERGDAIRICLAHDTPRFAALMMFFLAAFLVAMCIGCLVPMPPSTPTMVAAWCLVIAVPVFVYVRMSRGTAAGNFDLILHPVQKSLTISKWIAWGGPFVVAFADITRIDVVSKKDNEGVVSHQVVIHWQGADGDRECKVREYTDEADATQLAAFLRDRCLGTKS